MEHGVSSADGAVCSRDVAMYRIARQKDGSKIALRRQGPIYNRLTTPVMFEPIKGHGS